MNFGMYQKIGEKDEEVSEKHINRRHLLYGSRNKIHQGPLHTAGYISMYSKRFYKKLFQEH